jgi:hypothetical protein
MYTIVKVDLASGRPIRRIPIICTDDQEAAHHAHVLNMRDMRQTRHRYMVEPLRVPAEPCCNIRMSMPVSFSVAPHHASYSSGV